MKIKKYKRLYKNNEKVSLISKNQNEIYDYLK